MVLNVCPFNPAHNDRSACILQWPDGRLGFKCHHPSCGANGWHELRERLEPDAYAGRSGRGFSGNGDENNYSGNGRKPYASLPFIQVNNRQLRDISAEITAALEGANQPPKIFVRGSGLARIRGDADGRPVIDSLDVALLANRATSVADFCKVTKVKEDVKFIAVPPPLTALRDVLSAERWPFPPVKGIAEVPILRPDGPICITPGYDAVTELYYHPSPGFIVPEIPSQPTSDQMARAVAVIDDILADFPFVDAASRANAWATLIAALIRAALTGRVPAGLFDAPKSGSGKSLLASIIATVATGRPAAMFSAPKDDEGDAEASHLLSDGWRDGHHHRQHGGAG